MSKNLLNLLLIVSTFALYYLVINPLYNGVGGVWQPAMSIKSLQELNSGYTEALTQADSLYAQAETLQAQYSRVSNDQKSKMALMVPDQIDKVRLLSEVTNIINTSGLGVRELAYSDGPTNQAGKGVASVSFSVRATYPQFKALMENIEKSLRLFSIQSVAFAAPTREGEGVSYQVKLDTYFMK